MTKLAARVPRGQFFAGLVVFIAGLLLLSCQSALNTPQPTEAKVLKIVTSFPMQKIGQGESAVNGIKLALAEVNYQVGDYSLELVVLDDGNSDGQWDTDQEKANAEQAVADTQVVAYLGPLNSGAAKVSIPILNRGGILQISPTNTWPGLTKVGFAPGEPAVFYPTGRRNYFRTAPTDDLQAVAAVKWAESLGFQTVYILDDGEVYGKGLADLFAANALDSRLEVVGHETINKQATDFTDTLTKIKNLQPQVDLIYFGGFTANGAPLLVKQMRQLGLDAGFMGPDAIVDTTFIKEAGAAAEGVYVTLVGTPPSAWSNRGQKFFQDYLKTYEKEPEAFSQLAYDATLVILQAIAQSTPPTRISILNAAGKLEVIEGAAGHFEFDENGDTTLLLVSGNVVENQTFKFLSILPIR